MNVCLPTKTRASSIGIKSCSWEYWFIQFVFFAICLAMVVISIRMIQKEQALKIKYGNISLVDSDIRF